MTKKSKVGGRTTSKSRKKKAATARGKPASRNKVAGRKKTGATGKKAVTKKKAVKKKSRPAVQKRPAAKNSAARKKPLKKKKKPAAKSSKARGTSRKVIVVTGATGAQGGGLLRAILGDASKRYAVRAVTRNPQSDKAKALQKLGAETVKADLDDLDSVKKAFEGAYGAFCVTNFWEHFSPERELAQAANLAEAANATGLKHVIWSTLEDTRKWIPLSDIRMPTLMGRYKVPHFDAKGEADREFTRRSVPTTFLLTSFYWNNFIHFGMGPQRTADGSLAITLPMGDERLPGIASDDIGRCAYGIFLKGSDYIGSTVGVAGEHLSGDEMAAALGKALGTAVHYNAVEPDVYRSFGFPGAEDLGNMYQFNRDFSEDFCAARDLAESRALNPALQLFSEWLWQHKDDIPLPA